MAQFGAHVFAVLRLLSHVSESSVVSIGHSKQIRAISTTIDDLIKDYSRRFPGVKEIPHQSPTELLNYVQAAGARMKREQLRKVLHIVDKADSFGPLQRLRYTDQTLWLCQDHYRQMRVLTHGLHGAMGDVECDA